MCVSMYLRKTKNTYRFSLIRAAADLFEAIRVWHTDFKANLELENLEIFFILQKTD